MDKARELRRKIERAKAKLAELENRKDHLSGHGHWSMGYFTGMIGVLEDWLDEVSSAKGGFRVCTADGTPVEIKAPAPAEQIEAAKEKSRGMLDYILQYVRESDFDLGETSRNQLKALWTAHCLCNNRDVDTATYDSELRQVWNAIVANRDVSGSSDILDDFDSFNNWICEDLV